MNTCKRFIHPVLCASLHIVIDECGLVCDMFICYSRIYVRRASGKDDDGDDDDGASHPIDLLFGHCCRLLKEI